MSPIKSVVDLISGWPILGGPRLFSGRPADLYCADRSLKFPVARQPPSLYARSCREGKGSLNVHEYLGKIDTSPKGFSRGFLIVSRAMGQKITLGLRLCA